MFRSLRRIVALVVVVVLVVGGILVATARPKLERAQDHVETTWADLRPGLDARYRALAAAGEAVAAVPGPERSLATDTADAWDRWQSGGSVATEVDLANDLEGLGRRMLTYVASSAAVRGNAGVTQALGAFLQTPVPPEKAKAFNEAVGDYQDTRRSGARRLVSGVLGYDEIVVLDLTRVPTGT